MIPEPVARILGAVLLMVTLIPEAGGAEDASVVLEAKIPLGDISGRMDHFAIDLPRRRAYLAELGNNTASKRPCTCKTVAFVIKACAFSADGRPMDARRGLPTYYEIERINRNAASS